jgi:hypothetical protein
MIHRDEFGIICQHEVDNPFGVLDGGDSDNRTGIMALCGSPLDIRLVPVFLSAKGLVRHPFQEKWNKAELTSRDQLIPFAAGLTSSKEYKFKAIELQKRYSGLFINKDLIAPDVSGHLKRCAGINSSIVENIFLIFAILWSCFISPKEEQNQIICMVIVAGGFYKKLYKKIHPDILGSLKEYWNGWRDQPEISESLFRKLYE